jgi:superfamily II DNA or RNA helicase
MPSAPLRIAVRDRVRIPYDGFPGEGKLPPEIGKQLMAEFSYQNPDHREWARQKSAAERFGRFFKRAEPDPHITSYAYEDRPGGVSTLSLPRGGLSRVREALRAHDVAATYVDERLCGTLQASPLVHNLVLHPYQGKAASDAIARQNCIIRAPTASGKTSIALEIIARVGLRALVVVPTRAIFDVWMKRIQRELGIPKKSIGVIKSGRKIKLRQVNVAMQGTIAAMAKRGDLDAIAGEFGIIVADEVHRFAAETFFLAIDPFPAQYRIGVSADETRADEKEFLIYDLFGRVAANISRRELIEGGYILDVQICVIPTLFSAPWYKRHPDRNQLLAKMAEDQHREALIYGIVQQEVVAGRQVIVLTDRRDHVVQIDHNLARLAIPSGVMMGDNETAFRAAADGLESGRVRAAVGTIQACGTGCDFPKLDAGVICVPMASNRQNFGQVRGRVCRAPKGKEYARLYYLWDRLVYGRKALENIVRWNDGNVVVLDGSEWVAGADYLKRMSSRRKGDVVRDIAPERH